jgi:hypothetical protein
MPRRVRFTEEELREAVAVSRSLSDVLRRLGLRTAGGNHATIRKYLAEWDIPTPHFDPAAASREALRRAARSPTPLEEILVEHSTYHRGHLKERLYRAGLKQPVCELCGQGDEWRGRPMSLILDHINGVGNDHRLTNLRIVCPNCAATLDTHCGRQNQQDRRCETCDVRFRPYGAKHRFCSQACANRWRRGRRRPQPERRKVPRPPYAQLVREVQALGWSGVGRRYGVSDNAVRKWVRQYERDRESAAASSSD